MNDPEWLTLTGVMAEAFAKEIKPLGFDIPHPRLATFIVARVDGEMVGFGTAQFIGHGEPIYVALPYRGSGIAEQISQKVVEVMRLCGMKKWIAVARTPEVEKLCLDAGMHEVEGKIFVKD